MHCWFIFCTKTKVFMEHHHVTELLVVLVYIYVVNSARCTEMDRQMTKYLQLKLVNSKSMGPEEILQVIRNSS